MDRIEYLVKVIGATKAASEHGPEGALFEAIETMRNQLAEAVEQAIDDATKDAF